MGLDVLLGIVGFALVAGYVALAWLRRGRDPAYLDDPSILLPAPPPAMTAATAAIVSGGGGRLAFNAALLDLATRDEIAFVVEGRDGGADRLGIAFRGGETADPQVLINRRRPIGEAETWLLAELKAARALEVARDQGERGGAPPPEAIQAGIAMVATMMRMSVDDPDADDSLDARAAHEHGLLNATMPDLAAFERAYEQRTGHPMPEASHQRIEQLDDDDGGLRRPGGDRTGPRCPCGLHRPAEGSPAHRRGARGGAALGRPGRADPPDRRRGAVPPRRPGTHAPGAVPVRDPAPDLRGAPRLDEQGCRCGHACTGTGSPLARPASGIVVAIVGSAFEAEPLGWLGVGILAGALVTALAAPAMAALSPLGASMRAQLAAYRRTLAATFAQASSLDEARAASRLAWLETPDQTLVWGVALGLRKEIEAVMSRVGRTDGTTRYAPAWYRPDAPPAATGPQQQVERQLDDPAALFAGVEAIGASPPR